MCPSLKILQSTKRKQHFDDEALVEEPWSCSTQTLILCDMDVVSLAFLK